jgi:hypothetical protein
VLLADILIINVQSYHLNPSDAVVYFSIMFSHYQHIRFLLMMQLIFIFLIRRYVEIFRSEQKDKSEMMSIFVLSILRLSEFRLSMDNILLNRKEKEASLKHSMSARMIELSLNLFVKKEKENNLLSNFSIYS